MKNKMKRFLVKIIRFMDYVIISHVILQIHLTRGKELDGRYPKMLYPGGWSGCDVVQALIMNKLKCSKLFRGKGYVKKVVIYAKAYDPSIDYNYYHIVLGYRNRYYDLLTPFGSSTFIGIGNMKHYRNPQRHYIKLFDRETDG